MKYHCNSFIRTIEYPFIRRKKNTRISFLIIDIRYETYLTQFLLTLFLKGFALKSHMQNLLVKEVFTDFLFNGPFVFPCLKKLIFIIFK